MRIYPDTSILCRPYDDQSQPRIALETQAVVTILNMAKAGEIELIRSSVLQYENSRNPDDEERRWVDNALRLSHFDQRMTAIIEQRARDLTNIGVKPIDALHLASAEEARAEIFLACDDRLPRHYRGELTIMNPVDFVLKYGHV